jgi:hypothetical protein
MKGRFTDFNEDWYKEVGVTITKAIMIAAVFPIAEVVGFGCLKQFWRVLDRGFTSNMFRSKKKSIQQYVEL